MCILFYVSFIWLHVYAFSIHPLVHCGSAFEPGASGRPYYCTSICVYSWCNWHASLRIPDQTKKKTYTTLGDISNAVSKLKDEEMTLKIQYAITKAITKQLSCVRSNCNWNASSVAALQTKNQKYLLHTNK